MGGVTGRDRPFGIDPDDLASAASDNEEEEEVVEEDEDIGLAVDLDDMLILFTT